MLVFVYNCMIFYLDVSFEIILCFFLFMVV